MDIINPATGEIIKSVQEDDVASVEAKYKLVTQGQPGWARRPLRERLEPIRNFMEGLQNDPREPAELLSKETGKPLIQAKGEIKGACNRISFFLENSEKWLAPETVSFGENMTERIVYEPLGTIGNISAWNYPYLVGVNVFIPALLGGNAVLYKASEYASLTGLAIQRRLHEAGIPEAVFQAVTGGKSAGESMLHLPLDGYFFTGSYTTGRHIYETVAKKMVPCQLELGGKDPLYVTAGNRDVKQVAEAAADGAFYNNGQSCCAVERIYAHEQIFDEFIAHFVKTVAGYRLGEPEDEGVYIGPLTRPSQVEALENQVEDAKRKGAALLLGGRRADRKGYFFEPTVFTGVDHRMSLMTEESFGPVIGIQKVKNDNEAIALMKDTVYGLTASVYTDDEEQALKILGEMDSGTVYWNCCDRVSPYLPWSGRKRSGFGSTLSHLGIRAFVRPKAYHLRKI